MGKFFYSGIIFIIGYSVLNIIFYFGITKPVLIDPYLINPKIYRQYRNFLFSDSHGAVISQHVLDRIGIYNFAYDSDSYADMLLKIRFLINSNVNIDTIYLTVDNHTLSPYRESSNNLNRSIFFSNLSYLPDSIPISQSEYLLSRYVKYYVPLTDTNNSRLFYDYMKSKVISASGKNTWEIIPEWMEIEASLRLEKIRSRIEEQFPVKNNSEVLKNTLLEIIDIAIENKIKLVGIKFPLSGDLLSELDGMNYGADQIFRKNRISVFDFMHEFSSSEELFFDQDHLNNHGVIKFMEVLEHQILIARKSN